MTIRVHHWTLFSDCFNLVICADSMPACQKILGLIIFIQTSWRVEMHRWGAINVVYWHLVCAFPLQCPHVGTRMCISMVSQFKMADVREYKWIKFCVKLKKMTSETQCCNNTWWWCVKLCYNVPVVFQSLKMTKHQLRWLLRWPTINIQELVYETGLMLIIVW